MAGHIKFASCRLSRMAGGLQRRRALKSFQLGVSSHHCTLPFPFLWLNGGNQVGTFFIEFPIYNILFRLADRSLKTTYMFSGIVEEMATVVAIRKDKENIDFTLTCTFVDELKIDQSVSHNGVCLTVVDISLPQNGSSSLPTYTVTAMKETLLRSNLGLLSVGDRVNVERSMVMNGRLDGHIVQGHVDQTAICTAAEDADGSTYFTFEYVVDRELARRGYFTVDKGSVTVNGVSLTVCDPTDNSFRVAIIPYTRENTNFCDIKPGTKVNIEFDILGKYIARLRNFD